MNLLKKTKWGLLISALLWGTNAVAQVPDMSVRDRIYFAASTGNVAELQRLSSLGYSLDMADANGNSAYCQAVWSQNRTAVLSLMRAGADVTARCLKHIPYVTASSIYAAAHSEDLDQLVAWKKEGLNVDVVNPQTGNSALCEAVYNYDCPAIQTLLRAGSNQAQPCMRRIPQNIRENLQCRPLKIDWDTIGYTALGVGFVGGIVAILGSHGGNGTPTCPITQRWNGERCMTCDTCWIGNRCISTAEMEAEPYYRDEKTANCWAVSPPPVTMSDAEFKSAKAQIEGNSKYIKGGFLPMINASAAYARGYTGYMVERTTPYGRLVKGDVPAGKDPIVTDNKIVIGLISSGVTIGSEGKAIDMNTGNTTGTKVWNWTKVNKNLYDVDSTSEIDHTVSKSGGATEQVTGNAAANVSKIGETNSSFALNAAGTPYGYNYDKGPCRGARNTWKNCFGPSSIAKTSEDETDDHANARTEWTAAAGAFLTYYGTTAGKISYYYQGDAAVDYEGDTPASYITVETKTAPTPSTQSTYVQWANIGDFYADYDYGDYVWDGTNVINDPSPHYSSDDGSGSTTWDKGNTGTFLTGILSALKGHGEIYGVAYNAAVLPTIADTVLGVRSNILTQLTSAKVNIILQDSLYESSKPGINDALGAFSRTSSTATSWKSRKMEDVFGIDALQGYNLLPETNTVLVMGTGNGDGRSTVFYEPVLQAAIPLTQEYYGSAAVWNSTTNTGLPKVTSRNPFYHLFVTVGSVTKVEKKNNVMQGTAALYSQPCGVSASYCVVAPGGSSVSSEGLYSTTDPTLSGTVNLQASYGIHFGTSAAAATVSGALAVLMGAYPHLTPQQAVQILFQTATYLTPSDEAIDAYNAAGGKYQTNSDDDGPFNSIFGRGLINLEAATKPVGGINGLWVYNGNGKAVGKDAGVITVASTTLRSSASISPAVASGLPSTFIGFDAFNRPFAVETSRLFKQQTRRQAKSWDDFKLFMRGRDPTVVAPTENFSMMYRGSTGLVTNNRMPMGLMQMKLKHDKMTYGMFYTEDTKAGREAYWRRKLSNPFIQMHQAYGLETEYELNSKWSVNVGWTSGRNGFFDESDRHFDTPDNKMQALNTSVVYKPMDKLSFQVATGVMRETGSSLGMVSSGAFDIKGANTYYVGAGVAFSPLDKVRLEAMYYYGQTRTKQGEGLMNLSNLTSDSFAFTASYQPDEDTVYGLQVSSPLRVRSGTLNVSLPVGRHPTEDIYYYDTYKADMKPDAREFDLSMYYQGKVSEDVSLQSELGVRLHPDHQADAAPDYRGMVGVKWKY